MALLVHSLLLYPTHDMAEAPTEYCLGSVRAFSMQHRKLDIRSISLGFPYFSMLHTKNWEGGDTSAPTCVGDPIFVL